MSSKNIPIDKSILASAVTTGTIVCHGESISTGSNARKKYYIPQEFLEGFNTPEDKTTIDGIPLAEYINNAIDVRLRQILKEVSHQRLKP